VHLLLIRIGVAVGEAGCISPAHSLIASHFTRAERPRAVARYMLGYPLSYVIGYFLAGWLNELYGWRATFMILGLPGLALAALTWLTLKDPRREAGLRVASSVGADRAAATESSESFREVLATLWANRTFRHLLLCIAVQYFFGYGVMQWKPTFFIRSYGLETGEVGTWLAVILGVGGLIGTYWGGELASRYAANNERIQLIATAIAYCGFGIVSAGIYISPNAYVGFGLLAIATIGGALTAGPLFATIQTLVPPGMRAMSIAIVYLFANLIGMGLGPLAAGAMSDALRPWYGDESLRYALLILSPGYLWCSLHLWLASRTVNADLERMREHDERASPPPGVPTATRPSPAIYS
jgi:MFS family permease